MEQPRSLLSVCILTCSLSFSFAQGPVDISPPRLVFEGTTVSIYYDFLDSRPGDLFSVWIEITDSAGSKITARTLTGDIGYNIPGGKNKKIVWDPVADEVFLDAEIFIQVFAEIISMREEPVPGKDISGITTGGALLRTAVLPGWGQTKISQGKPFWLIGVAGYGCLATSIIYNQKAASSYNSYLSSYNIEKSETFYDNSVKEDNISKIFAYSAIGILATDLIWTTISSSRLLNRKGNDVAEKLSLSPGYDHRSQLPIMTLKYRF